MTRRRILLVNPNTSALVTQILASEARRIVGEAAEIDAVTAPFGAASLECRAELVVAAHAVLEAIAAHTNYDAAVIGAFGDPGLEAAQDIARAPVFGLGRSGLRAAAAGGRRFAIVTIGERMRPDIERMVVAEGLSNQLTAIRFLSAAVLDVAADRALFSDALVSAAHACVTEGGAQSILFGGAPFAGIAHDLADRIAAPVFDGLASAMRDAMEAPPLSAPAGVMASATPRKANVRVSQQLAERIHDFLSRRV
ncbi:aspartate/glutamate racemase family protein [Methylocapsa sp. S129]|uniref:aspartate/glutamate racemase family protein n=1 Tax=Methylocapsa sp. S129 TaxID=1641869 RepID=UPI00131DAA97|nr:aspartate/glutamate racemase family protein [Methylocapsa sp. S129]